MKRLVGVLLVGVSMTGCSVNPDLIANEAGFRSIERLVSNAISNSKKKDGQLLSGAEITQMETTREVEKSRREESLNQAVVQVANPTILQRLRNKINGMMSATNQPHPKALTYEQAMDSRPVAKTEK